MHDSQLFGLTPETVIRDSLYDLMPLSAEAASLLRTPPMLRLDGIQQLGFVSRVWPGARHTRFEHSLGVMHLMHDALQRLHRHGAPISDEGARAAIAAALLHDVGHYPFSHAIEELGDPVLPHEVVGRRIIASTEIETVLRTEWRVDPEFVVNLIDLRSPPVSAEERILRSLLSGTLDVDKLDYLPRDARACSVPYGGVDTARLLDALTVIDGPEEPVVGVTQKGISPLHSLINARQEMFDNVYWHHTNRACMVMLLRAVQEALIAGLPADELTDHTDTSLLGRLLQPDMPQDTKRLVRALQERRIHKRAVEISYRAPDLFEALGRLFSKPAERRDLERKLAETIRTESGKEVQETDILIDIPKPERWTTRVWVQFDRPPVGFEPLMSWQDVTGVEDSSLRAYEEHRRLIRIVAAEPLRDTVRAHWERLADTILAHA